MHLTDDRIMFAGDWHGILPQALSAVNYARTQNISTIIQMGDFGIWDGDEPFLDTLNEQLIRNDQRLYFIDGNHECLDPQTRAITPDGFKDYTDLSPGDLVLSVQADGTRCWQPIQDVIVRDFTGNLVFVNELDLQMCMTPGHRVVYREGTQLHEVSASSLLYSPQVQHIVRAATNDQIDADTTDEKIRAYAAKVVKYCFPRLSQHRILKPEALGWSERQTDVFMREVISLIGKTLQNIEGAGTEVSVIPASALPDLLKEDIQFLGALNGWKVVLTERSITLEKAQTSLFHEPEYLPRITEAHFEGQVWCVSVPNGHFFVEKHGTVFLTGNCFPRLYSYPLQADGTRAIRDRIIHLPRGLQFTWGSRTVTAMGGGYSVDRQWRIEGLGWWPEETLSEDEIRTLHTLPLTDILLSHDSPYSAPNPVTDSPTMQAAGYQMFGVKAIEASEAYRKVLDGPANHLRPRIIIHGHYHAYGTGTYQLSDGHEIKVYSLDQGGTPLNHHTLILDRE